MTPVSDPVPDPELRSRLLEFYVESHDASQLADWLRQLGLPATGSVQERRERVRTHTKYLSMPARDFPQQTRYYLDPLSSDNLADLCLAIGLPDDGTRDDRYRRLMREVRYRESWLPRWRAGAPEMPLVDAVAAHLQFFPIVKRGRLEQDFCGPIAAELAEVFGERTVHEQLAVAHGSTLKIDFHIGPPQGDGVGLEVKVPANNGDIQRSLGQVDQYLGRYGPTLIMLIIPDFISEASLALLEDQLRTKSVQTVVKRPNDE